MHRGLEPGVAMGWRPVSRLRGDVCSAEYGSEQLRGAGDAGTGLLRGTGHGIRHASADAAVLGNERRAADGEARGATAPGCAAEVRDQESETDREDRLQRDASGGLLVGAGV